MWTLRPEQLAVFQAAEEQRFEDEALQAVHEDAPAAVEGLTDAELRRRVRFAIARARTFGFEARRDLKAFTTLMLALGPRFHEHRPFSDILAEPQSASIRAEKLLTGTHPAEWQRVREQGARDTWPEDATGPLPREG